MGEVKVDPKTQNNVGDIDPIISEISPYSSDNKSSKFKTFIDGFKPPLPDEKQKVVDENKYLTTRHLVVIALTSGTGTGLMVANGENLKASGPLPLLIGYFVLGFFMLIPTMNAAGELNIAYPNLPGGFAGFFKKFLGPDLTFALSINYVFQWAIVIPLELVTASMICKFWNDSFNPDIIVAVFLVVIIVINCFGVRGYGEAEFVMNTVKLLFLGGFVIFGLAVDLGASKDGFIGGKYYRDPGMATTFKGFASCLAAEAFSFGGTEFISLSAAEQVNPRKSLKTGIKLVVFRVVVFFLGSLVFVGLLVPYDSPNLMGGDTPASTSPYVLAAQLHGVKVLPHIINACLLNSVTSVATAAMYSSSRMLHSLAEQGLFFKQFRYLDRSGRPLYCWLLSILISFFAFIATYGKQNEIFNWLLAISALSFLFIWAAICICHLKFRAGLKRDNIPLSSLAYVSPTGIIGSYLSIIINALVLIAQFWTALFPTNKADVYVFFQKYLAIPFLLVAYFGYKIFTGYWRVWLPVSEIDIDSDRVIYDPEILELEKLEEKDRYKKAPFWQKVWITCFQ